MANINTDIKVSFSPETKRLLDRFTKVLEKILEKCEKEIDKK